MIVSLIQFQHSMKLVMNLFRYIGIIIYYLPLEHISNKKIGDIWGRRMVLLAWKLDGWGRVVDEVVILSSRVVGGNNGVYRRIKGGETVNTKQSYANRC